MHTESYLVLAIIAASLLYTWKKKVYLTPVLLVVNMVIFFISLADLFFSPAYSMYGLSNIQVELSYVPRDLTDPGYLYTILSSMYIHSGFVHVFFNMFILFLIGMPLEERIGTKRFAIVYFGGGLLATMTHTAFNWNSAGLLMGASGAVSAAMGAMLVLYPKDEIPMLLGPIFLQRVPVWMSVGFFFGLETAAVISGQVDGVAHTAHVGGIIGGIVLAPLLMKAKKGVTPMARGEPDYSLLEAMATGPEAKEMLKRILDEDLDEVRELWVERFMEEARCPKCGEKITRSGRRFSCERCEYRLEI